MVDENKVIEILKQCYDPEIPVDLWSLGLIYNINISKSKNKKSKPEEPQTWRGELVSLMTQFVAPGAVIAKVVGRIGKEGKIKKLQLAMGTSKASTIAQRVVQGASIVGATDFVASQEGRDTLYFEPESLKGLTGSKRAAASLRNKLRHGAEGTIIGGGFPLIGNNSFGITLVKGSKRVPSPAKGIIACFII